MPAPRADAGGAARSTARVIARAVTCPPADPPCAPDLPPALLAAATRLTRDTGEAVFRTGDAAHALYFVRSGAVRLIRHGAGGEEVPLHDARSGEFFAEASLDSRRYHCDAIAVEPSELLQLPAAAFQALLDRDSAFARQWISRLTAQLRTTRARVERLSLNGAAERVRHLLHSEGQGPRCEYRPRGSLKDLARLLGLSHEALYRTLAAMQRDGSLERDGTMLRLPARRAAHARRASGDVT